GGGEGHCNLRGVGGGGTRNSAPIGGRASTGIKAASGHDGAARVGAAKEESGRYEWARASNPRLLSCYNTSGRHTQRGAPWHRGSALLHGSRLPRTGLIL